MFNASASSLSTNPQDDASYAITILALSACSLLLFTSLNNRARPCRLFRNPNRVPLSRSTAIRATEFLSPKSIPTKMCLTCIEASLLSKDLALFYSEPVPRLAFFYIVNSSRGGESTESISESSLPSLQSRQLHSTSAYCRKTTRNCRFYRRCSCAR